MPHIARLQTGPRRAGKAGPRVVAWRPAVRPSSHSARLARAWCGAHAPPMGTARWPRARPAASNRVMRCREFSGDSSRGKRGRCRARRNWRGRTEPATLRRGGEIGLGWQRSGGGRLRRSSAALGGWSYDKGWWRGRPLAARRSGNGTGARGWKNQAAVPF
jgi:hypothetical protein